MKKIFGLIIIFMLSVFIPVNASDIEIQPTMFSRSNAQDRVWVGTLQLMWSKFIDKYVHTIVRFREGTPIVAKELNQKAFPASNLSEKYYYMFLGEIKKNTCLKIGKALRKKFKETSEILYNTDLVPAKDNFFMYTMLKKNLEFIREFDKLGVSEFGKNDTAEYFGINENTASDIREGVKVLFYNNPDDFAIALSTNGIDKVYMYKNSANKDFKSLYKDMRFKTNKFIKQDEADCTDRSIFGEKDKLKIPNINFDVTQSFDELTEKRVMGTNLYIGKVIESIKFNMDSTGSALKNKTKVPVSEQQLEPEEEMEPRFFNFNNTFVIFLKETSKEASEPYFALRVHDIKNYQRH